MAQGHEAARNEVAKKIAGAVVLLARKEYVSPAQKLAEFREEEWRAVGQAHRAGYSPSAETRALVTLLCEFASMAPCAECGKRMTAGDVCEDCVATVAAAVRQ